MRRAPGTSWKRPSGICYVLSTLRRAARVSAHIVPNGTPLMEFTHSPE